MRGLSKRRPQPAILVGCRTVGRRHFNHRRLARGAASRTCRARTHARWRKYPRRSQQRTCFQRCRSVENFRRVGGVAERGSAHVPAQCIVESMNRSCGVSSGENNRIRRSNLSAFALCWSERPLKRGAHRNVAALAGALAARVNHHNDARAPVLVDRERGRYPRVRRILVHLHKRGSQCWKFGTGDSRRESIRGAVAG